MATDRCGRFGRWQDASNDYARAIELKASDPQVQTYCSGGTGIVRSREES